MNNFEIHYAHMINDIIANGQYRKGRNGNTKSVFGKKLEIDMTNDNRFPLLTGRKMFLNGVLSEFAALVRGPKNLNDFKRFGCNYWDLWADKDGLLNIDYGNLWKDFNGVDQMAELKDKLLNNPSDRRMIISGWNPANLKSLSLPCCHLLYQWYVNEIGGVKYLDMIWYQRSVDTMIGLPSDIILAAVWNIALANEVDMKPGKLTLMLGDTHIYEEHFEDASVYIHRVLNQNVISPPDYKFNAPTGLPVESFTPDMLEVTEYDYYPKIKFRLKQ